MTDEQIAAGTYVEPEIIIKVPEVKKEKEKEKDNGSRRVATPKVSKTAPKKLGKIDNGRAVKVMLPAGKTKIGRGTSAPQFARPPPPSSNRVLTGRAAPPPPPPAGAIGMFKNLSSRLRTEDPKKKK